MAKSRVCVGAYGQGEEDGERAKKGGFLVYLAFFFEGLSMGDCLKLTKVKVLWYCTAGLRASLSRPITGRDFECEDLSLNNRGGGEDAHAVGIDILQ